MSVRILVVDDENLVRSGLRLLLDGARGGDFTVVGEAADGESALQQVRELKPDVVLMDIRMPGRSGIDAVRDLANFPDPPPVLMLTAFDTREDIVGALSAGAKGFLRKVVSPEALISAIDTVVAGHTVLSPDVIAHVVDEQCVMRDHRNDVRHLLSHRESCVAELVSQGKSNEEIGKELHLALPTVKTYMTRIMEKLGAANRVQVAVIFLGKL